MSKLFGQIGRVDNRSTCPNFVLSILGFLVGLDICPNFRSFFLPFHNLFIFNNKANRVSIQQKENHGSGMKRTLNKAVIKDLSPKQKPAGLLQCQNFLSDLIVTFLIVQQWIIRLILQTQILYETPQAFSPPPPPGPRCII